MKSFVLFPTKENPMQSVFEHTPEIHLPSYLFKKVFPFFER